MPLAQAKPVELNLRPNGWSHRDKALRRECDYSPNRRNVSGPGGSSTKAVRLRCWVYVGDSLSWYSGGYVMGIRRVRRPSSI